jgi:thiamine biosynthesis lipoprotein
MACRFDVTLPMSDRPALPRARAALALADHLEHQLTIFNDRSEVSFINRTAASGPVPVEASLFGLLLLSQNLSRETKGAFDITSGPLSECWGFLKREGRIPEASKIEAASALTGPGRLILDRATRTARFDRPGVQLNLGSIGKGYALDCMTTQMRNGVRTALLSAGSSSMTAIGSPGTGTGWLVGVRHPGRPGARICVLRMRDCSMATSGGEQQFFEHERKRYGHIIDPRSGCPAEGVASATVIAQSAAVADALATAFFVAGPQLAKGFCSTHPGVSVIMLANGSDRPLVFGNNPRCEVDITVE